MLKNNLDFNHIHKIIEKGLTNRDYYRILGIIGQSKEPVDNIQIFKNINTNHLTESEGNKYIYEILKELSPLNANVTGKHLFVWEDLKELDNEQLTAKFHNVLEKINQSFNFKIDNHLKEDYIVLMDGESIDLSKKWIKIQKNDKKSISYNAYFEDIIVIINSESRREIFPVLAIKKKGKLHVYSKSYTSLERRRFLDITNKKPISLIYFPEEKIEKSQNDNLPKFKQAFKNLLDVGISVRNTNDYNDMDIIEWFINQSLYPEKENLPNSNKFAKLREYGKIIRESIDEMNRTGWDRQYFRYNLSFRGLLLFLILYGSIKEYKSDKLLFDKVLSNPSIVEIAPFLQYLNDFEKLGFHGRELIVTIAEELRNQLHLDTSDGTFLLERAIERYYSECQKYISFIQPPNPSDTIKMKKYNELQEKVKDYRKNMNIILKDFVKCKEMVFGFSLKELD